MPDALKVCPECSNPASLDASVCTSCGHEYRTRFVVDDSNKIVRPNSDLDAGAATRPMFYVPQPEHPEYSKDRVVAGLLALFLGMFGVHGFYLANIVMGGTVLLFTLIGITLYFSHAGAATLILIWGFCAVQSVLYLSATDSDFHTRYVERRRWF